MSKLNQASVDSLQQRWNSDAEFKGFRRSVLESDPSEEWFSRIPKLPHPWEKDELGDFRGVNFANQKLVKIDLTSLRFDHADFAGCDLYDCSFQGAVLSGASFVNATLCRAHMIPVYGQRVDFAGATLSKSSMENSKLLDCSFFSARLDQVGLSHADLSQSSLVNAKLSGCRLDSVVLAGADLDRAALTTCDLVWLTFQHAQMRGVTLTNCDMHGTDFRGADLSQAAIHGGAFGVVQQGDLLTPTRFDDTPEARRMVADSGATGIESIEWHPIDPKRSGLPRNAAAGQPSPRGGFWFTPAQQGSRRYFNAGDVMPVVVSEYGATSWQWDPNQDPPKL